MVDLSRWLPGLAPDPEEDDPVSRTLRMLGLGGAEAQPAPVSTYNDPTAYLQQPAPYTPPPPADDPGGAGFAAQDAFSAPPLQDDRWRDEGPRESAPAQPAPPPQYSGPSYSQPRLEPGQPSMLEQVSDVVAGAGRGVMEGIPAAAAAADRAIMGPKVSLPTWEDPLAPVREVGQHIAAHPTSVLPLSIYGEAQQAATNPIGQRAVEAAGGGTDPLFRATIPEAVPLIGGAEIAPSAQDLGGFAASTILDPLNFVGAAGAGLAGKGARAVAAQAARDLPLVGEALTLGQVGRGGLAAARAAARRALDGAGSDDLAREAAGAADEGVQMLGSGFVPRGVRTPVQVVNNAAEQGITALYHETSPRDAFMLTSDMSGGLTGKYVSPDPAFALGQAGKGALVELGETGQMRVSVNRAKPGLRMLEDAGQGVKEMVVEDAPQPAGQYIKSITVQPDARMDPVARGISRGLERDGWTVETLADGSRKFSPPTGEPGGRQLLGSGVVPEGGGSRRMYHGTNQAFERFDIDNPQTWLTADPVDAGYYAGSGPRSAMTRGEGANIRAVDVPNDLRLIDQGDPRIRELRLQFLNEAKQSEDITTAIRTSEQRVVQQLMSEGYEGVSRRTGLQDQVTVFPNALPRLRNAFSGEAGGSGVIPSPLAGLRADAFNAAQGGVAGAVSEDLQAQAEGREVDYDERLRRGLGGAVLAGVGGRMARGGGPSLGAGVNPQPTPRVQRAAQSANPHVRDLARQMQGRYQPSGVEPRPLMERIAAALTDRHAIVGNVEQEIQGRIAAAGGTAPATRLAERVRQNPNSIAAQRAREELAPALQKIGDDADWAEQYLVHRHNLDVAKAKGQEAYDEVIARGGDPAAAQAAMDRVRQSRLFSGGMTEQEIVQAVSDIQTEIGPARFQNVVDTAQAHWDTWRRSLDEKLAEGMISPTQHQELTTRYPHYVRTDIADYFEAGPAAPTPGGRTMGVSSVGIKAIDRVGTTKDRVNPVLSTIDGMYAHEAAKARNAAAKDLVQLRDADPDARALFKEVAPDAQTYAANPTEMVPPDYSLRGSGGKQEQKLTAWENGEARQFVIPAEYGQLVSPSPGGLFTDNPAANGLRAFFGAWKAGITTHNPAFQMVVSPVRDFGDYAVGEATRSATHGGPLGAAQAIGSLPGVVADYVKALPAAFEGLGTGQVGKELGALRRSGAGMDARPQRTDAGLREIYADLARSGGMAIRSPSDVVRAARTVLTLGAEPIGSRLEQVPRIAAARRAAGRGADELGQAMAARDATIDFQRGGSLTQQLNAVVPFLNPTVQSAAQVKRLAQQNPAAFSAAVATGVGLPAMVADAWNRSDPQRAQDYEDVPDSVKNGGIVWMLPGVEGETALGERKPNYLFVPLGSFAFAARMAREGLRLADPLTGLEPTPDQPGRDTSTPGGAALRAADVLTDLLGMFSPVKGESLSSSVASLIPPGASEMIEWGLNKDLYRGNTIATDRTDERASNLSKGIAGGLNTALNTDQVRASQVEHVIQGVAGYPGQVARGASDLGRDRGETRPVQDLPVVGGLVSRIVRDAGGQRLQDVSETDARVPQSIRPILAEAGMRSDDVKDVPSRYKGGPLTREEQELWQRETNDLIERYVDRAERDPKWRNQATREQVVRDAITRAREDAARRARLPSEAEMERRARDETARKAG